MLKLKGIVSWYSSEISILIVKSPFSHSIPMIFPVRCPLDPNTDAATGGEPAQQAEPIGSNQADDASTTGYMTNHGEIWVCLWLFVVNIPVQILGLKIEGKTLMNPWWRTSFSPMRSRIFGIHLIFSTQIHGKSWFETGVTLTSSFSQEATWSSRGYKHSLELVEKGCRIKGVLRYNHFKCRNFSVLLVTMVTWWL